MANLFDVLNDPNESYESEEDTYTEVPLEKQLRKQKKKLREIDGLKSKPHKQLNDEQKAKIATEGKVKRQIKYLEKLIDERKNPTQVEQSVPKKKKKTKKKKKKKKNNMTAKQRKAYETHREIVKKERETHKNENMLHGIKVALYRKNRQEYKKFQEEYTGWLRNRNAMFKLLMNSNKEKIKQVTQTAQTTQTK